MYFSLNNVFVVSQECGVMPETDVGYNERDVIWDTNCEFQDTSKYRNKILKTSRKGFHR